ncbi:signal peptide peptidase SppA [Leptospira ilyithenensis]|uniref:Signal peptide peptidase SppA n=1 Tax=Leptospira ilyithenensis TaxID=2484901 RepID=A0A4R9LTD5_9LEPT|nr:signal peptide peptidase SppA [Leptospira ilyithenensis]TGN16781.1 signal peptide peptidase SppA [Leptospira ilyithenensis]
MSLRKHFFSVLTIVFSLTFLQSCIIGLPSLAGTKADFEEKLISGSDKDKILIIPVEGVISDESRESSLFGSGTESMVARIKESLKFAEKDPNIQGVILKINSPGGTVTASDIIYQEIQKFRIKKGIPVFSAFMDTAASGAYYIAMSTDSIGAHPTTVTGSIGVIMQGINVKEGLDKIGVKDQSITSGSNKAMGSPLIEQSPEQKKILQSIVDGLYDRFFQIVKKGRPNVSEARLKEICDGRIFTAEQAKKEGLVDFIGYFDDFQIQLMKHPKYGGHRDGNPRLIIYQRGRGKVENIYQTMDSSEKQFQFGIVEKLFKQNSNAKFFYLWDL